MFLGYMRVKISSHMEVLIGFVMPYDVYTPIPSGI